jgi:hypothetical protein
LKWLGRQGKFARQPYRQLAKVLRDAGDDEGWRAVCFEMEKRAWRIRRDTQFEKWKKAWLREIPSAAATSPTDYLLRGIIGYGYKSFRAVGWIFLIWAIGTPLYLAGFRAGSMVPTQGEDYTAFMRNRIVSAGYEEFHVTAYSFENSFPLIKLGIQEKWEPSPDVQAAPENNPESLTWVLNPIATPTFLRWFRWVQIALGWILTTFFAAGVTGLIRKD